MGGLRDVSFNAYPAFVMRLAICTCTHVVRVLFPERNKIIKKKKKEEEEKTERRRMSSLVTGF